jgi:hypothetical protein
MIQKNKRNEFKPYREANHLKKTEEYKNPGAIKNQSKHARRTKESKYKPSQRKVSQSVIQSTYDTRLSLSQKLPSED